MRNNSKKFSYIPDNVVSSYVIAILRISCLCSVLWIVVILCQRQKIKNILKRFEDGNEIQDNIDKVKEFKLKLGAMHIFIVVSLIEIIHFIFRMVYYIAIGIASKYITNINNFTILNYNQFKNNLPLNSIILKSVFYTIAGFETSWLIFFILSLAVLMKYFSNYYSAVKNSNYIRKYFVFAIVQFMTAWILTSVMWTLPIGIVLLAVYYFIDFIILEKKSRELKRELIKNKIEAQRIGGEIGKKHSAILSTFNKLVMSLHVSLGSYLILILLSQIHDCIEFFDNNTCHFSLLLCNYDNIPMMIISYVWIFLIICSTLFNLYLIILSIWYAVYCYNKIIVNRRREKAMRNTIRSSLIKQGIPTIKSNTKIYENRFLLEISNGNYNTLNTSSC